MKDEKTKIPCVDCITLAICKARGIQTNGVITLTGKCDILRDWLSDSDVERGVDRLFYVFRYFDRGSHD